MKTTEEVQNKINELEQRQRWLWDFLSTCYKGSDTKAMVEKELLPLKREINSLKWVLDNGLPF